MIKWLLGIMLVCALLTIGYRLIPVYIDNHAVSKIANEILDDTELKSRPKRDVLNALNRRFIDHNLTHLEAKEVVKVARGKNGELVLDVKYEERRKLLYNLEIVAGFDEQFSN